MIRLDWLQVFVTVVESGSMSAAAKQLHLSKSVVSNRLGSLEESLGVVLLQRTTRAMSLTASGEYFLDKAAAILADLDAAVNEISARQGQLIGPLRIAAPLTFGKDYLAPALFPFMRAHPHLELILDLDDRRADLSSDPHDLAIRIGKPQDSRLVVNQLALSRRVLVASPGYLETHGRPKNPADLADHHGIFYSNRGAGDWRFYDGETLETARAGRAVLHANNGETMRDAAVAGLGIALLPMFIVSDYLRAGTLILVDIGVQAETDMVFAAYPLRQKKSPKIKALLKHLSAAFGDRPQWEKAVGSGS